MPNDLDLALVGGGEQTVVDQHPQQLEATSDGQVYSSQQNSIVNDSRHRRDLLGETGGGP